MSNLAVIPARGGSKRIPNKNVRYFLGQPVLKYSIDVALTCGLFDEVMVSTDDEKITSLATSLGAKLPFKRSEKNSDDLATLTDVLSEVIENYKVVGKHFDFVCLLLPTAPLISSKTLLTAYNHLRKNSAFSVVIPVVRFSFPIQRAFIKNEEGQLKMLYPENKYTRSQDLPPAFHDSGQFYWIRTSDFLREKSIFMNVMGAIELSELEAQDIDTETDWKLAEIKYTLLNNASKAPD